MTDALSPVPRTRLYEQLIERLRAYVRSAGLNVGDRLPAERELAARLQVSRVSVKQALLILEVQGAITTRQGGGSYLTRAGAAGEQTLAQLIERREQLPPALEARHALEVKFAQLAAVRRTEGHLNAMEQALDAMAAEISAGTPGIEPTRLFHDAVYHAADNDILYAMMAQLAPHNAEIRRESLSQPGRPIVSLAEHRAILAAIRSGDPVAAVAVTETHMHTVARVRLLDWTPPEDPNIPNRPGPILGLEGSPHLGPAGNSPQAQNHEESHASDI